MQTQTHLTRAEYDSLVTHRPVYMANGYQDLTRVWNFNGVTCTGHQIDIANLKRIVASLNAENLVSR